MIKTANDNRMKSLAVDLGKRLESAGLTLVTAESCTGGGVAYIITSVAGSSAWFDRGFVVYSNNSKVELLHVSPGTLSRYGAVSEEAAREMAAGSLENSNADISLAVTGIAGPGGGSSDKPVGTVCFAWQRKGTRCISKRHQLKGDRESIRIQSIMLAIEGVLEILDGE